MNILILGATGLAGTCIRETLAASGHQVRGACRRPGENRGLYRYELDDPGRLEKLLAETGPEVVISCLRGGFDAQLEAHRLAADYLAARGGRMIYLSTANVFDAETDRPHYETDEPRAESGYGLFKIACERLLKEKLGENLVILRPPEIWGRTALRLQGLLQADREGAAVSVYANNVINFTTDRQVAAWTAYILENDLRGIFHVGTRDECTHGGFRRQLAERLGLTRIRWEESTEQGCQSVLPGRAEIPDELHATVEDVLRYLAGR